MRSRTRYGPWCAAPAAKRDCAVGRSSRYSQWRGPRMGTESSRLHSRATCNQQHWILVAALLVAVVTAGCGEDGTAEPGAGASAATPSVSTGAEGQGTAPPTTVVSVDATPPATATTAAEPPSNPPDAAAVGEPEPATPEEIAPALRDLPAEIPDELKPHV